MTSISDEFAEYALNLAATNIVLLVGICKREGNDIFLEKRFRRVGRLKQSGKTSDGKKVEAIKKALNHFEVI